MNVFREVVLDVSRKKQKVGSRKVNPPASTTRPLVQGKEEEEDENDRGRHSCGRAGPPHCLLPRVIPDISLVS